MRTARYIVWAVLAAAAPAAVLAAPAKAEPTEQELQEKAKKLNSEIKKALQKHDPTKK